MSLADLASWTGSAPLPVRLGYTFSRLIASRYRARPDAVPWLRRLLECLRINRIVPFGETPESYPLLILVVGEAG